MTTRDPILEKLAEKSKLFQRVIISVGNCTYEEALAFKGASEVFAALEAVLAIEKKDEEEIGRCEALGIGLWDWLEGVGRNDAIDEIRTTIANELGVEE